MSWLAKLHVRGLRFLWLLLLSPLLLSCQATAGGNAVASPTGATIPSAVAASPTPTDRPLPTATPTSTPTPTLTPTPTSTSTPRPYVCPLSTGKTKAHTFWSEAMQEQVNYLVHLPPCYHYYPQRAFPVLYLLHGWPLNEYHWQSLGVADIADAWFSQGLVGPVILVMPGVTNPEGRYIHSSGGEYSFEGMLVNELLPAIDQEYRTWRQPEGRAVGGISRGGVWSLEIGLLYPDLFGIVGGHSPALAVNHPLPAYDPFLLAEAGAPGQRIYLDAGDADWTRAATIRLRDLLLEKGADVTYQVHEGAHVDRLWRLGLPDYLRFYTRTWPRFVEELPAWEEPVATPEAVEEGS